MTLNQTMTKPERARLRFLVVLVVLDGWGMRPIVTPTRSRWRARPPITELVERFPHTSLVASGEAVGLPAGQMGNSEVGHMNMGAGRIVYQDLTRIDKSIRDGDFFDEPGARGLRIDRCQDGRHALHLRGPASPTAACTATSAIFTRSSRWRRAASVPRVFVHVFTDGRDTSPTGGREYVGELERADATPRHRADRDRLRAVLRDGSRQALGAHPARLRRADDRARRSGSVRPPGRSNASYAAGVTDEFIEPVVIIDADGRRSARLDDRGFGHLLQLPRRSRRDSSPARWRSTTSTASSGAAVRASR